MEIRVQSVEVAHHHLLLGCVVVGPKKSWIRFCLVKIPLHTIRWDVMREAYEQWESREPDDQPMLDLG